MRFKRRLAALAAAGSAAALVLVAGSAVASTHSAHLRATTGREVAQHSGTISYVQATARNQAIPVRLRGVVNTTGLAQLGGYTKTHSFFTRAGRLAVRSSGLRIKEQVLNASTCLLRVTVNDLVLHVAGKQSTGRFAGAWGRAYAVVRFWFNFPKRANGSCNYRGVPRHKGQVKFLCVFPAMTVVKK
jgi:hypothetical protein